MMQHQLERSGPEPLSLVPVSFPFAQMTLERAEGAIRQFVFNEPLISRQELDDTVRCTGSSRVSVLAAALATVLFRYGNTEPFGLALATEEGVETVAVDPSAPPSFAQLAKAIDESFRAGDVADASATVCLHMAGAPPAGRHAVELNVKIAEDVTLAMTVRSAALDEGVLRRLPGHMSTVLRAAVQDVDVAVDRLPLLTATERQMMLVDWNATRAPFRDDATITDLFEEQVARRPDAPALLWNHERISYAGLNARVDRLSRALIELGVGPEVYVGICMRRTPDMIAATLAILKAGGAYVPLDPANPPGRLETIVNEAGLNLLLTQQELAAQFAVLGDRLVTFESLAPRATSEAPIPRRATPANAAYVIYTSGSTGKPKGVVIDHRAVCSLVAWAETGFSEEELGGSLLSTSMAFDVSVFELFAPLCTGGTVILTDDILTMLEAPARDAVRLVNGTSAGLAALARSGPLPSGISTVMQAGEAMYAPLAQALYERGVRRVVNLCGATEDTVFSEWYEVPRGEQRDPAIGRPFANREAYILDRYMEPVPIGVAGELYYAGTGLAREYRGRADLTAERFVANPFPDSPYPRLYKSGDLVRFRDDGNIEYISRIDDQLKIRGYRVELAEVEANVARHPDIAEAAVVPHTDAEGDIRLDAYAVMRNGNTLTYSALRGYVAERLPDYMLPATLTVLDVLPRAATGKLDRKALPAPSFDRPELADTFVAPRDEIECALAEIWHDVTGFDRIGVEDDFFVLGGHSLMAARVSTRIRERYGIAFSLGDFFRAPRIAAMALTVRERTGAMAPPAATEHESAEPDGVAVSYSQEQLWFVDRLVPNGAVYNVPLAMRIRGNLDETALHRTLDALMARHPSLRTFFAEIDGSPAAFARPLRAMPLQRIDVPDSEQSRLDDILTEIAREPFDLHRGPLVRATLLRLSPTEHVLVLSMHHIVTDAWSLSLIFDELTEGYGQARAGRPISFVNLSTTYGEYAAAERSAGEGRLYDGDLEYWSERLKDVPQVEIIGNRRQSRVRNFDGALVSQLFDGLAAEELESFARARGVTAYAVTLAAYLAFLQRFSGADDLTVGVPVAGRRYPELEALVGYFVSMVTLRVDLSDDPTFDELICRTRETLVDALDHQSAPFQMVVERVAPERDQLKNPLFSTSFVMSEHLEPVERGGVSFEPQNIFTRTAKFDLLFEITQKADELIAALEYSTERYDGEMAQTMLTTLVRIIKSGVEDSAQRVSSLAVLPPDKREALIEPLPEGDATAAKSALRRFERQASIGPAATAIIDGETRLTYGELNRRANVLANMLTAAGAGPGRFVGLCAQRNANLPVAILGILKTGAAYVPIDPDAPRERVAFIASDAEFQAAVTDTTSAGVLPAGNRPIIVLENVDWDGDSHDPRIDIEPESVAYAIYTSGSTGKPKGVAVSHRNLAWLLRAADEMFDFGPADSWTLFHSFAFDFSVWELWGALAYGGRLVIVPRDTARAPEAFYELVAREGVTVLNQTPSAFYEFIDVDDRNRAGLSLRYVIFGGEALDVSRLQTWFDAHGDDAPALINMFGITETTVHVTYRRLRSADVASVLPPIGVALPGAKIYLLDARGKLAPDFAPGEMYVGGDGVAQGYLRRPELSAARFLPNPLDPERGEIVYRSGDLARRLPDGSYEYLRRADDQVKIRGFRIEIGEVEHAVASHPDVDRAVVLLEGEGSNARLVAYVVMRKGTVLGPGLREHVARLLASYMVPSTFHAIDAVPINQNGKLDRAALQRLAVPASSTLATPLDDDATALQVRLSEIFREVLGVQRVGLDDNFFTLGGHSLMAARLVARVEREFPAIANRMREGNEGKSPLLTGFYAAPTVRSLTEILVQGSTIPSTPIVLLQRGDPNVTPLFFLHGMFNGDGFYIWEVIAQLSPSQPVYVIHPHGYNNLPFKQDIDALSKEQFELIQATRPHGPYRLAGFCNGGLIAYDIATRLIASGERVESLFLISMPEVSEMDRYIYEFCGQLARILHMRDDQRSITYVYAYRYFHRMARFLQNNGHQRRDQLRRGWTKGLKKAKSLVSKRRAVSGGGPPVPPDWSSPLFKIDTYAKAIMQYMPLPYNGEVEFVWGRKVVRRPENPSRGWWQLAPRGRIIVVDGGHECVVESAEQVGLALRESLARTASPTS